MIITQDIYNKVRRFTKRFVKNLEKREDLMQDVFIKLIKFPEQPTNTSSFVYTTVKNVFCKQKRNEDNRARLFEMYQYLQYNHTTENTLDLSELSKMLDPKSKQHKAIKIVIDNPDLDYRQMAKLNKINYNTFKANVRHAQKIIQKGLVQ